MKFPEEKTKQKRELWQYSWLIYGPPKIGKSTFVSQFNDPLFIATEDRLRHINAYKIPETGSIKSWDEFLQICNEINKRVEAGSFKWKTVVIDTVDNLFSYCSDFVCKREGISDPSDMEWGKGFRAVKNEFFRVISKLNGYDFVLVFISHSADKEIKTRNLNITKTMPSLEKVGRSVVMPMVDIIGHVELDIEDSSKKLIRLQGDETIEAGSAADVEFPTHLPLDYKALENHFKGTQGDKK